jgi:type II secretion system protein D
MSTLQAIPLLILVLLLSAPAHGQDAEPNPATTPPPAQPAEPAPIEETAPAAENLSAAESNSPVRNIRFQFDGMPYMDVVERFAQMVNKPLLSTTNVQGSLTFNDSQPYTYHEALDTLNVILSMRGVMLIESGRYLRLVPFKQLSQMPLKLFRGLDETGDTSPGEIVTVVLNLNHVDPGEIAQAASSMLSNAGSIAPLSRGRGLIITDRLESIHRLRELLAAVDTESTGERQMKTYSLFHASGAVITDLINRTFGVATAPKRTQYNDQHKRLDVLPPNPNDYITAVFDDASRTLVLFGPADRVQLAEELIKQFEDKQAGRAGEIRIFHPQAIRPDELARMLREAIPGIAVPNEAPASAATKARLIIDAPMNRLIVASPTAGQLEAIENLINRIDQGSGGGSSTGSERVQLTKVFRMRSADPATVSKVITDALSRRTPTGTLIPLVTVTVDSSTKSLVVTGSPGEMQQVVEIVTQLDSAPTPAGEPQTKFIDVGTPEEARRLSPLLEQLYRAQVEDGVTPQSAYARIILNANSSQLIVTGTTDHIRRVEAILAQLRQDQGPIQPRQLRIVTLQHTTLDRVLTTINQLVQDRMNDRSFRDIPKPSILPDNANNRMLVTATENQHAEIDQIVTALDVAPERSQRQVSTIRIRNQSAAQLLPLINQLLAQEPTLPGLPPAQLIADPSGTQIIALGTPKQIERVQELVLQLDGVTPVQSSRQFRGVELHARTAAEITPLVQQLYQEQLKGLPQPPGGPATLFPETQANLILVSGSEQEITRVETIIRQLDPAGRKPAVEETRVLRLKSAMAGEISTLVQTSLNAQPGQIKVLVDQRSNSLIVTGASDLVEAASKIVEQLDTPPNLQPREIRVIDVKSGDAAVITPMVTTLFAEMVRDQRGPNYVSQTRIVADSAGNRIIVSGARDELGQVAALVDQLDQPTQDAGGARVFKLNHARASDLASLVGNVMVTYDPRTRAPIRRVTVSADANSNSLIVSGARHDVADAATIIEKLDSEAEGKNRSFKIVEIQSDQPAQLAASVSQVFLAQHAGLISPGEISLTPEPSGKRLIVLAPMKWMPDVEQLIASLDHKSDNQLRELRMIELKNGTAAEILPIVIRIHQEQAQGRNARPASIVANATNTRLAVVGTPEQFEAIEQIVATIESERAPMPRQTKIFELGRLTEVHRVLPLAQQLYQTQIRSEPQAGPADAQMISDGWSGRLIVSARQDQMPAIEEIIQRLQRDLTAHSERETRTFELGSPQEVSRLLPLVQQLYQDELKDKGDSDPADARMLPDTQGGRLIVTARPSHLKQIETILSQLGGGGLRAEPRETRVYDLTSASAAELAMTVRTLYQEHLKTQPAGTVGEMLVLPDAAVNRLIVSGPTNQLPVVDDIVRQLDKVTTQTAGTRVFRLKTADASQLASILSTALMQRGPYGRQTSRVSVGADPRSNTLIVSGDPKDIQSAAVIIEQLDEVGSDEPREMRFISLAAGMPSDVALKLRQLYQDQLKAQKDPSAADALILGDDAARRLILAASASHMKILEDIASRLEEAAESTTRQIRSLALTNNSASAVSAILSRTFAYQIGIAPPPQRLVMTPSPNDRTLIVEATPPVLERVEALVRSLDEQAPGDQRELRLIELKTASAVQLVPVVTRVYSEQTLGSGVRPASIVADPSGTRLAVIGSQEQFAAIEKIVASLEMQQTPGPSDTRVYELNTASAAELATTARTLYQENRKSRPGTIGEALILPDVAANRIILSGPTNEVAIVDQIIQTLDKVSTRTAGTRVFRLKTSDASQVATLLTSALMQTNPYGRQFSRLSVGVDSRSNTLIVSGDPKDLQAAAVIIEQLDELSTREPRQMRFITLKSGVPSDVATKLRQLYQDQLKAQEDPGTADALILGEDASNRLILAASESQMALLEKIVAQFEEAAETTARQIRSVALTNNSARAISIMLARSFSRELASVDPAQRLVITPAPNDRSLVVEAPGPMLARVEELVRTLDEQAASEQRELRMIELKSGSAQELVPLVTQIHTEQATASGAKPASIVADPSGTRLGVVGSPAQFEAIERIVASLESQRDFEPRDTRVYDLNSASAAELAATARILYQEDRKTRSTSVAGEALILPDAAANRIIISGSTNEIVVLDEIIQTLDKVSTRTAGTRVFRLKTSEASQVATLLTSALTQTSQYGRTFSRISVGADARSNTLIVSGDPKDLQAAAVIIEQLDGLVAREPRQMRFITLKSGVPSDVALKLRQLYQDQLKAQEDPGTADALILGDDGSNRLILAASESQMAILEEIVGQFEETSESTTRQIRSLTLTNNSAMSVSAMLSQLFSRQIASTNAAQRLVVTAAPNDRTLIVEAAGSMLEQVETIVLNLDQAQATSAIEVRTYQVPEGTASELAPTLARLFAGEQRERRGPPSMRGEVRTLTIEPRFEADPNANILMVAATRDQFEQIEQLIAQLPTALEITSEIRTFHLKHSDPLQMADILSTMLGDAPPASGFQAAGYNPAFQTAMRSRMRTRFGAGSETNAVRIAPAPSLNAIVVQAAPSKMILAEQLISTLDRPETDQRAALQTVHLRKALAENVAEAVNKAIIARGATNRTSRVTVTPVLNSNSLLVDGPMDAIEDVMKLIRDLDEESRESESEVRIYKLENGEAKQISPIISQILQGAARSQVRTRGAPPVFPATVAVDERANSLIVSGTAAQFKMVEQLLETFDQEPERSNRVVEFIWLQSAKASDVAFKIQAVYEDRPKDERPVIEYDSFSNSLTVIGRRADIAEIQSLVERIDESIRDGSVQVRMLPISIVPADQIARMLQNIYSQMSRGDIRVVDKLPPMRSNSGALPSNPPAPVPAQQPSGDKHEEAPAAEADPAVETSEEAPAPPIGNPHTAATEPRPAANPAELDENGGAQVMIAIDPVSNSLLLSGPAHELDYIDRLVFELSFTFTSTDAEFRQFTLKEADPVVVARTLNELFKPEPVRVEPRGDQKGEQPRMVVPPAKITVVAEPRTRSVIIRAKVTEFPVLESLIKQLDAEGLSSQLEHRLIPLQHATPDKIVPLVMQMVNQLSTVQPGEPLTVTAAPRANGVLVIARDFVLNQIEKMVQSLDTPSDYAEVEVLLISLRQANAQQLSAVLQNMLKPGTAGELTPEARELQEQIRRLRIQNDRGLQVVLDLTRPIKIMADPITGQGGGNRLVLTSTPDNLQALAAVISMMDNVPLTEGVSVRLYHLDYADADAVSTTLSSIFTQGQRLATGPGGPSVPEGDLGKALVSPLNVAVDRRSNTVIISGREESLDLAQRVIEDLDKPIERFVTEVRLFRMKHASASRIAPVLQSVFAEGGPVAGSEGLSTQVTRLQTLLDDSEPKTTDQPKQRAALVVQPDDTANILIVAARRDMMPLITDVIEKMDIPSASGMDSIRLFPLQKADAASVQRILNDLYDPTKVPHLRREDKPNITIDERTNVLIVSGNQKAFAIIEGLILKLDSELPQDMQSFRIIPLENADASILAVTVQRLLDARVTQQIGLGRQEANALRALVIADPRSNSLLVGGSRDSFELVEALVKELDQASPDLSGRIRIVPLNHADARTLATTLNSLFAQQVQILARPELRRSRPVIVADPRSNSLLVGATGEQNRAVDELIARMDQKIEDPSMTLSVVALRYNDAARVATMIGTLFTARQRSQTPAGTPPSPQDQVDVQSDSLSNALIISASKDNLDLIQGLLEKLDIEPTAAEGVVQAITLQHTDAQRAANMLRELISQGLYRPGAMGPRTAATATREALAITVDPRSNTLIVSASPENLAVIRELIKQIDQQDFADSTNIRLYTLKRAKASHLALVLDQFFRAKRANEALGATAAQTSLPITITPDDRTNTLLVTGGKESFEVIDRMIEQLDGEDIMARTSFRVFHLTQATATKVQDTLQKLFLRRPPRIRGEAAEPITIVADTWANSVIVGASPEDLDMVATLIERLDQDRGDSGGELLIIPLAKADARRVAQTLQSLYRDGGTGTAFPVVVNVDERLNAIIVSAGEADGKRIAELVKRLDTDTTGRINEIRVIPLKYSRAEALSVILTTALTAQPAPVGELNPASQSVLQFITRTEDGQELIASALKESLLITPDPRMNALIVSAPVDYMHLLEQIIGRLDNSAEQRAKIKVFSLQNADARQMADLLAGMFRLQPTAAQMASQRSIQYTLILPNRETGQEQEVASAVLGSAEQNALTVTVDPRTNGLLVGGSEHYVALVTQIIESLDSAPAQERKSEVYRLRNSQAADVESAIRSFLDQDRQRVTQLLGDEAMGTIQRVLDREIAIVAEPTSNTILLSASPRYFPELKALIEELDQPQAQVLIQVILAEVTLDSMSELGVEWKYASSGGTQISTGTDFGVANDLARLGGFSSAVTGSDFSFLLRALRSDGRLEVLSRPQILTADNQQASINVGQRVPLVTDTRTLSDRGDTISQYRYENVGVSLNVTPRISPEGFVKMDIMTTNSALSSSTIEVSRGVNIPIINERRASTTVSVQSGQSIIIGGLISTSDDTRTKKVPFLGSIPYFGALFRSTKALEDRKELLMVLTPQVLVKLDQNGRTTDSGSVSREQLDRSYLKDKPSLDRLQDQILQPLFPELRELPPAPGAELPL